jgi:protein-S-isoprenylcysteine O-methyltransferase Ste14
MNEQQDTAGVLMPPPALFAGAFAVGLALDQALPLRLSPRRASGMLGAALTLAGVALGGWAALTMRRRGTSVNPLKPSTAFVATGPFRRTRNPIYVGMTVAYAGAALASNRPASLLVLPAALWLLSQGVIDREERYLEHRFGAEYDEYCRHVPRWL